MNNGDDSLVLVTQDLALRVNLITFAHTKSSKCTRRQTNSFTNARMPGYVKHAISLGIKRWTAPMIITLIQKSLKKDTLRYQIILKMRRMIHV